ncbi:Hypothetical predicted protein [Mytilus galloprovincialis]|uniref:Uncharacterized protein n=1 Tax=Mytilus galloprovincialis TaxID=29158 RepID=A0A8B6CDX9_MYTGA|nr:Hypothetical predicted protein [Mytilus galloprovincialis]
MRESIREKGPNYSCQIIGLVIFALGMVLKFGFEKVKPYLDDALNIVKASGNLGAPTLSDSDLKEIEELVEIAESILKDVAIALIIVGSVMLVIVLLGCWGACNKIKIFLFLFSCCGVDNSEDFNVCTSWDKKPVSTVSQELKASLACWKSIPTGSPDRNALSCAISPQLADSNSKTAVIIFLGCWIGCKEGEDKVSPSV